MRNVHGSVGAVERTYASHYRAFCRMATAVAGDAESGRDAVQEGFANALASLDGYRGEGPLQAWLWRIVFRAALDGRKRGAREELRGDDVDADDWSPVLPHPERDPQLAEALAALPSRQRLIVFLRYFADLSHTDIAQIAGVELGTVSATLTQAKAALARRLALEGVLPAGKEEAR